MAAASAGCAAGASVFHCQALAAPGGAPPAGAQVTPGEEVLRLWCAGAALMGVVFQGVYTAWRQQFGMRAVSELATEMNEKGGFKKCNCPLGFPPERPAPPPHIYVCAPGKAEALPAGRKQARAGHAKAAQHLSLDGGRGQFARPRNEGRQSAEAAAVQHKTRTTNPADMRVRPSGGPRAKDCKSHSTQRAYHSPSTQNRVTEMQAPQACGGSPAHGLRLRADAPGPAWCASRPAAQRAQRAQRTQRTQPTAAWRAGRATSA